MNTKKKKPFSFFPVGITSMLVIFILLCLVTFSVLSLVTARADSRLSAKNASRLALCTAASSRAEETLAEADLQLLSAWKSCSQDKQEYFRLVRDALSGTERWQLNHSSTEKLTLSFSEPVQENQLLMAEIEILFPEREQDPFYRIIRWTVENTDEWEGDNTLPLADFTQQ